MSKISHIELYVSDYAKSVRFYDKVLCAIGWKRLVCRTDHTTFSDGQSKIVLCPVDEQFKPDGYHRKRIGLNHLAFFVDSKEEVASFYKNIIKDSDISCLYDKTPSGEDDYYAVFFEDPDRIKLEVVYAPGYCEPDHYTNKFEDNFDPYA